jgi:hypothetical protein
MKRYRYIPFAGNLAALKGPELAALKEVNQGWYVEYSATLPSARQLAKQISAFANQSGGWLFVGVKGQERGPLTAEAFPGIPAAAIGEALAELREAGFAHVTPEVQFETGVIEGPVSEIDLAPGRSIIIVGIPEGTIPPYVHSSGCVYRRASDQSEPTPEVDRRELDVLRNREVETRQRLADFLSFKTGDTHRETYGPVRIYVYLLNDPFVVGESVGLSYHRFSDVMQTNPMSDIIAPGFSNVFTSPDGYTARCLKDNEPLRERLAFRWWASGNARLTIPVDTCDADTFPLLSDPRRSDFVRMLRGQSIAPVRIADFSEFLSLLAAGTGKYLQLRQVLGLGGALWGKVRFCGAWRATPFINLRQYIESVRIHGFPVVQDDEFYSPPGFSTEDLIKVEPGKSASLRSQSVLLALRLAVSALRAVGIDFDTFIKDEPEGFLNDLGESMNFVVEEPL